MIEAVTLKNVTKTYKQKYVVQDVSFSIHTGELFGLLGVNGAGKTTIIHMLCGLKQPSSGDITIFDKPIATNLAAVKPYIALSPQQTAVAPNLTVYENLALIGRIHGYSKDILQQKIDTLTEQFSLQPYLHQRSKTLSGGWQRKLNIAMALITEPKLLFLDEPTLGLDIIGRRELWHIIQTLKQHVTIVLTTHYLEEAEALCDRICIMKDGRMQAIGTTAQLLEKANTDSFEDAFIHFVSGGTLA